MISDASILQARQVLQRCGVPADDLSDEQVAWYIREREARRNQVPVYHYDYRKNQQYALVGYLKCQIRKGQIQVALRYAPAQQVVNPIHRSGPARAPRYEIITLDVMMRGTGGCEALLIENTLAVEDDDIQWLYQCPEFAPLYSYWDGQPCPVCGNGRLARQLGSANLECSFRGRTGNRGRCNYVKAISISQDPYSLVQRMMQTARQNEGKIC